MTDLRMGTQSKITVALLLVLVTAVVVTGTLGYFIYERTLARLVGNRYEFIAADLRQKVEAGLDLGLPLGELENINSLLRQEMRTDAALTRLTIQNARGVVLFDTEPEHLGLSLPIAWSEPATAVKGNQAASMGRSEIALPLVNSFGKVVGGLTVAYSQAYFDAKRERTALELAAITAVMLFVCGAVGVSGVLIIARPLDDAVRRLDVVVRACLFRLRQPVDSHYRDDAEAFVATLSGSGNRDIDERNAIAWFEGDIVSAIASLERAEAAILLDEGGILAPRNGSP